MLHAGSIIELYLHPLTGQPHPPTDNKAFTVHMLNKFLRTICKKGRKNGGGISKSPLEKKPLQWK
jgi:hypothetical protein